MTKILIVDDEPAQSRGLQRAILLRRPEFTVLTALNGVEAVSVMQEQQIDLVVTDLQMMEMDGLELLAWLLSHRPSTLAFAMTAYAQDDTEARLRSLGAIECFRKPLDIEELLARLSEGIAHSIQGHVQNVGLASFLQLIEIEQKTCTLEVRSEEKVGRLFLRKGELLDARTASLGGEEAALTIIGWMHASIGIEASCRVAERTIWKPVYHIVMESMRVHDENHLLDAVASERRDSFLAFHSEAPSRSAARMVSIAPLRGVLHMPAGALAVAVIEVATGKVVVSECKSGLSVEELAQAALLTVRLEQSTLELASVREPIEEVVTMTSSRGELIRPLPSGHGLILLVFDPNETNLVMARLELDLFEAEYALSLPTA